MLSLFLLRSMNPFLMTLLFSLLGFVLFHSILRRYSFILVSLYFPPELFKVRGLYLFSRIMGGLQILNLSIFVCGCLLYSNLSFFLSQDNSGGNRTLDLASSLEVRTGSGGRATQAVSDSSNLNSCGNTRSVLTIAFQFAYENNLRDSVAVMARQYVRSVVASVQRVAMAISPSRIGTQLEPKQFPGASPEAHTLARWVYRSYRYNLMVYCALVFFC